MSSIELTTTCHIIVLCEGARIFVVRACVHVAVLSPQQRVVVVSPCMHVWLLCVQINEMHVVLDTAEMIPDGQMSINQCFHACNHNNIIRTCRIL